VHGYSSNDFYGSNIYLYLRADSTRNGIYFGLKRADCGINVEGRSAEFSKQGVTNSGEHRIRVRVKDDLFEYYLNGDRVCLIQDKIFSSGGVVVSIRRSGLGNTSNPPPAIDNFSVRAITD